MTGARVATWIDNHLWAILAAAGAAYGGYLTGMTTINHRVEVLESKVSKIEDAQTARRELNVCIIRSMDRINDKLGLQPACPMQVPE